MKFTILLVLLVALLVSASATPYHNVKLLDQGYKVEVIPIQNNVTGYFSGTTGNLYGELLGLVYAKGNVTAGTNTITVNDSLLQNIDSYNVTNGSVSRVPGLKILSSNDSWAKFPLMGPLTISTSNGTAWKAATVYIIYRG